MLKYPVPVRQGLPAMACFPVALGFVSGCVIVAVWAFLAVCGRVLIDLTHCITAARHKVLSKLFTAFGLGLPYSQLCRPESSFCGVN